MQTQCGLGIRPEFFNDVLTQRPELGFIEAHSENYFGHSIARERLRELRDHYPVSLHGVGLSLGRADALDSQHLQQLKSLVDLLDPILVSEHLAWSAYSHRHIPDLLPLPLTEQALTIMSEHVDQMQQVLGRQVLVENPSNYFVFDQLQISEPEFLNQLAHNTGCGLLVDVNNIHVSSVNVGRDPRAYLRELNSDAIAQYHLAGYTEVDRQIEGESETVLIDTHNQPVYEPVWELYRSALEQHGVRPTLFEWDSDFPEFAVLVAECEKANVLIANTPCSTAANTAHCEPVSAAKAPNNDFNSDLSGTQQAFLDDVLQLNDATQCAVDVHQHRIGIYQNNAFGALLEYLLEVFPATAGVVGKEFFKQMSQTLIQVSPPSIGNVHEYGGELTTVLGKFEALSGLPYLADLIKYEWALHSAYYAHQSDPEHIDPASVTQEALLSMAVGLNNSAVLIDSQYPIYEIHRQSLPDFSGQVAIDLQQSQDTLLVFKQHQRVQAERLSDTARALIEQIEKSKNLLQAIDRLSGSIEMNELSANLAFLFEKQLLNFKAEK